MEQRVEQHQQTTQDQSGEERSWWLVGIAAFSMG